MSHASRLSLAALALLVLAGPALAQETSALAAGPAIGAGPTESTRPRLAA